MMWAVASVMLMVVGLGAGLAGLGCAAVGEECNNSNLKAGSVGLVLVSGFVCFFAGVLL